MVLAGDDEERDGRARKLSKFVNCKTAKGAADADLKAWKLLAGLKRKRLQDTWPTLRGTHRGAHITPRALGESFTSRPIYPMGHAKEDEDAIPRTASEWLVASSLWGIVVARDAASSFFTPHTRASRRHKQSSEKLQRSLKLFNPFPRRGSGSRFSPDWQLNIILRGTPRVVQSQWSEEDIGMCLTAASFDLTDWVAPRSGGWGPKLAITVPGPCLHGEEALTSMPKNTEDVPPARSGGKRPADVALVDASWEKSVDPEEVTGTGAEFAERWGGGHELHGCHQTLIGIRQGTYARFYLRLGTTHLSRYKKESRELIILRRPSQ
ncbi:hypothetical protein BJ322DRAFT_1020233 [Thelephora terrestris]|uniref:Uncharacterized protein n=1 Tax=Thelephora terrestris TaxID=56493 RepID=A0A9P6HFU6_9AGAM|nr:hypothetical protein BJ322DRAFT_1020233 [Thelephora terrestris]